MIYNFKDFIKESLSEEELDSILDKIGKSGFDSLTKEEKIKLSSYGKEEVEKAETTKKINNTQPNNPNLNNLLYQDDDVKVFLTFKVGRRDYLILFKNGTKVRLEYLLDSRNFINFNVYDNNNNIIEFKKLPYVLKDYNVDYSIFNKAFYHCEENFNNVGYRR